MQKPGNEHYRKRVPDASGFVSSPITSGNKVYCTDQNGKSFVLEAGTELKVLATNDLGEMCWSSAAIAGNVLLIRTIDHLYCDRQSKFDECMSYLQRNGSTTPGR